MWSTCELIERRLQLAEVEIESPSSQADAFDSCGRLKTEIEKHLPLADRYYYSLLEGIALWARMKVPVERMSCSDESYKRWLSDVLKLQYSTRPWRERIWLEIENLPWSDIEKATIVVQLLWETTPPTWLRMACEYHRMPLVSEPMALGGPNNARDRSDYSPTLKTIYRLADWAERRMSESDGHAVQDQPMAAKGSI